MSDVPSPKASRQSRPKWLDPKLFLGILLVLGSMAFGARIIGQADNTTTVKVAKETIAANGEVTEDSFETTEVRFPNEDDANRYVRGDDSVPNNARTTQAIGEGEMVPKNALTNKKDRDIQDFAVPVSSSAIPDGLKANDVVDVILRPSEGQQAEGTDTPSGDTVLENVVVLSVPNEGDGGAVSGDSAVTLRVDLNEAEGFSLEDFYGRTSVNDVVLTRSAIQSD